MRILLMLKFPLYGGGSGTYTRKLAEKLSLISGHTVAIVSPDTRQPKNVKLYPVKLPFEAVFETHPEFKKAKKYRELSAHELSQLYQTFLRATVEAVEEFRPDIIHVQHASYLTWIASHIKSLYGIPFVVTAHGTGIYNTTLDNRFLILTKQALSRAEYIICVSGYIKKWLLKVYGKQLAKKTRICPGGVDLEAYEKPINTSAIEREYKLKNKPLVLAVGRITKQKGLDYLIKAAKDIRGLIYIIGDGDERKNLEQLAAEQGANNVHFLGYFGSDEVKKLRAFYKRANVLVVPSVCDEALGLVILESMAAETPVVASRKGGIPIVVKDGQTGFLARARSPKALSDAINKIIGNPKLEQKLGANAKKLVFQKFSWKNLIKDIEKIYERSLLSKPRILTKQPVSFLDKEDIIREQKELTHRVTYTG